MFGLRECCAQWGRWEASRSGLALIKGKAEFAMKINSYLTPLILNLMLLPLSLSAGCASVTSKIELDTEVKRLCRIDGGIKVYETVKLPADKFNRWGQINFYRPTQGENALGPEYIYRSEDYYYHQGSPTLVRYRHQVIRRSDGKLLGETTSYGRGGGDLLGPWEPSTFRCPATSESSEIALFKKIFEQKELKQNGVRVRHPGFRGHF
jgi:hypothetical protein